MNEIEKLLKEIQDDCDEVYYKNRTNEQKRDILIDMFNEVTKLGELISKEMYSNLLNEK